MVRLAMREPAGAPPSWLIPLKKRWYFDVVSTSSKNEYVTIVFYNVGPVGFPGGFLDGPLAVEVSGSFSNGTLFDYMVPATVKAAITEDDRGLLGDWQGAGARFQGSSLSRPGVVYSIDFNSPELGVFGKVTLKSVSLERLFTRIAQARCHRPALHSLAAAN